MTATNPRANQPPSIADHPMQGDPGEPASFEPGFDRVHWEEAAAESGASSAGGRTVLGTALIILGLIWTAYTAWSAGRALAVQPLSSPQIAQWIAVAAGPLALLGLVWLMFGRTRRKEAERFTRSVVAMRTEARSLEALLAVLRTRLDDSHAAMTGMAEQLMQLGDQATGRLDSVTRSFDSSAESLARHGAALDRAAESARNDVAVLLDDLPRAEATALGLAEHIRVLGNESLGHAAQFERQVGTLTDRTREADELVAAAAQRLVSHLTHIESAGAAAASRVGEAESGFTAAVDTLLDRTATALADIRTGVDVQSAAVAALVEEAAAGIGRAGIDAAHSLNDHVRKAGTGIDLLSERVAEQERVSQRMVAELERALSELDGQLTAFAAQGDERSASLLASLGRARSELQQLGEAASQQDGAVDGLASRTESLRASVEQLSDDVRSRLESALGAAEAGTARLIEASREARPEIEWMRDASVEASNRIAASAQGIEEQQDRFAALLAALDDGAGAAEERLGLLASSIGDAQSEALRLSRETGPALVTAMAQVHEAAAHAAKRAQEALSAVIPNAASELSAATREALESAIREGIEERLLDVQALAARAVDSAREASERLTQQMLNLGQSATALEQHVLKTDESQREKDSEAFARRVSLLIDSMHSAAIDVGKILSDEIDEKAWDNYLKGDRAVFTRRAVRLLGGGEGKAIRSHYESDAEFHHSVDRYVHDFEAMLRRVLAERDGGMIAVTLMSSDMGKLYAALADAIDRRR
jgi:hypothetical protein